MAQFHWGLINPDITSGTRLAELMTDQEPAQLTNHSGDARPSYARTGLTWIKTDGTVWDFNFHYEGVDHTYLQFDTIAGEFLGDISDIVWGDIGGNLGDQEDLDLELKTLLKLDGSRPMTGNLVGPSAQFSFDPGARLGVQLTGFGINALSGQFWGQVQWEHPNELTDAPIRATMIDFNGLPTLEFGRPNLVDGPSGYLFHTDNGEAIALAGGFLTLPYDPTNPTHAVRLGYLDNQGYLKSDGSVDATGTQTWLGAGNNTTVSGDDLSVAYQAGVSGFNAQAGGFDAHQGNVTGSLTVVREAGVSGFEASGTGFSAFTGTLESTLSTAYQAGSAGFFADAAGFRAFAGVVDNALSVAYQQGVSGFSAGAIGFDALNGGIQDQLTFVNRGTVGVRGQDFFTVPVLEIGPPLFDGADSGLIVQTGSLGAVVVGAGQVVLPQPATNNSNAVRLGELSDLTQHALYGAQHTDVDTALALVPRHGLFWNTTEDNFVAETRTNWRGEWMGGTYYLHDMVTDDGLLMVANKTTNDKPAPVPVGEPAWRTGFDDSPPWVDDTLEEDALYTGARFVALQGSYLYSTRFWVPELDGSTEYECWLIVDPMGVADKRQLRGRFVPLEIGWFEIGIGVNIVPAGVPFDVLLVKYAQGVPNVLSSSWEFKEENGNPDRETANGQSNQTEIRVANWDLNEMNNWQDEFAALENVDGIKLSFAGREWDVVSTSNSGGTGGGRMTQILEPNQGWPDEEDYVFTWTWGDVEPIEYVVVVNHWASDPNINGFITGNYFVDPGAVTLNNNAYGVDIFAQPATVSDDWDFASSGGSGSSGGGGAPGEIEWPLRAPLGSVTAPSYGFNDPSNPGWFFEANALKAGIGGASPFSVDGSGINADRLVADLVHASPIAGASYNFGLAGAAAISGMGFDSGNTLVNMYVNGGIAGSFTQLGFTSAGIVDAGVLTSPDIREDGTPLGSIYNTIAAFNSHVAEPVHFTEASINHSNIQNRGALLHSQLDDHVLSSPSIHFPDAAANGILYGRRNNDWEEIPTSGGGGKGAQAGGQVFSPSGSGNPSTANCFGITSITKVTRNSNPAFYIQIDSPSIPSNKQVVSGIVHAVLGDVGRLIYEPEGNFRFYLYVYFDTLGFVNELVTFHFTVTNSTP